LTRGILTILGRQIHLDYEIVKLVTWDNKRKDYDAFFLKVDSNKTATKGQLKQLLIEYILLSH